MDTLYTNTKNKILVRWTTPAPLSATYEVKIWDYSKDCLLWHGEALGERCSESIKFMLEHKCDDNIFWNSDTQRLFIEFIYFGLRYASVYVNLTGKLD